VTTRARLGAPQRGAGRRWGAGPDVAGWQPTSIKTGPATSWRVRQPAR
jgi:hypothetical protein